MNPATKWWMKGAVSIAKDKALSTPLLDLPKLPGKEDLQYEDSEAQQKRFIQYNEEIDDDLDDDDDNDLPEDTPTGEDTNDEDEGEGEAKPTYTKRFYAVLGAAILGLGANIGSIVLLGLSGPAFLSAAGIISIGAGLVGSAVAPYAVIKEKSIADVASRRDALNQVRKKVQKMQRENKKLNKSRRNTTKAVKRLKECEEKLQATVKQNASSVDELFELLEENNKIMMKLKDFFDAKVVQDCVRIIMKYDKDKDFILSSKELPMLIYALKSFDVDIGDAEEFKQELTDRSVPFAIQYVSDILKRNSAEELKNDKYALSKPSTMTKYRKVGEDL